MKPLDRRMLLWAAAAALPAASAYAAPNSAAALIGQERALAAQEGKGVLIEFYASWCVWCRPMEALLSEPAFADIVGSRFRVMRMRVLERREDMRARQAPGADEVFTRYGSANVGLPFLVFLDSGGQVRATTISRIDGQNIGFPVEADELDRFGAMLSQAAPDITVAEHATIREACARAYARAS